MSNKDFGILKIDFANQEDLTEILTDYIQRKENVVVKFSTAWCPPCQVLQQKLEEWDKEDRLKNVLILGINADESGGEVKYRDWKNDTKTLTFSSIPTLFIFEEGKVVKQTNNLTIEEIKQFKKTDNNNENIY